MEVSLLLNKMEVDLPPWKLVGASIDVDGSRSISVEACGKLEVDGSCRGSRCWKFHLHLWNLPSSSTMFHGNVHGSKFSSMCRTLLGLGAGEVAESRLGESRSVGPLSRPSRPT